MNNIKNAILLIAISCLCCFNLVGQQVVQLEYFIDTDPGTGQAIQVPIAAGNDITANFSIDITNLTAGPHILYVRAKDAEGEWSLLQRRPFYWNNVAITSTVDDIVQLEYFLDTDPGTGQAIQVPISAGNDITANFDVDLTNIDAGAHILYVRAKNNNGKWSLLQRRSFIWNTILQSSPISDIVAIEYFVNTDPGIGNATAYTNFTPGEDITVNIDIDLESFGTGDHIVCLRGMNSEGRWSLIQKDTVHYEYVEATCTDGYENGDEEGIDCGGANCIPCPLTEIFVDHTATGDNNGSSWSNAFTKLEDALAIGVDLPIHIAKGTYLPTETGQRSANFNIPAGCTLLGGYANGGSVDRDVDANRVNLSGDIDNSNSTAGDSYHVVRIANVSNVVIDGVTIRKGNADQASSFGRSRGGGVYAIGASAIFRNVRFKWNRAIYGGGIFATLSPEIRFEDCEFSNNTADYASCMYHSNQTNMYIIRTKAINNNAMIRGAMEANNSLYTYIENSLFANNSSTNANGLAFIATNRDASADIYNTTILGETKNRSLVTAQVGYGDQLDLNVYNSIIAHQNPNFDKQFLAFNNNILNLNTYNCYIQGSSVIGNAFNNIYEDVVGDLVLNADFSLDECSPGVDDGNNSYVSAMTDIEGNDRIMNTVDMGAFEAQTVCASSKIYQDEEFVSNNEFINIYPNPTKDEIFIQTEGVIDNIQLFDIRGSKILTTNEIEISLSTLPQGIYVVKVFLENGSVHSMKVSKK